MTDPSKLLEQKAKERSPESLDARILAAAKKQAEANAEKRNPLGWNWMPTAATAAVFLVGITIVFNNQLFVSEFGDTYSESGSSAIGIDDTANKTSAQTIQPLALDEVVVTARSREESLQDIPITIEVLGPEVLEEAGVNNLYDLFALVADGEVDPHELTHSGTVAVSDSDDDFDDSALQLRAEIAIAPLNQDLMKPELVDVLIAIPNLVVDIRYAGSDNFIGEPIDGYNAPKALLSQAAVEALAAAHDELFDQGLSFMIFDTYRPQRAVDHFIRWSQNDDQSTKSLYYPNIEKSDLFSAGYLSEQSSHSRGSTVDLTIVRLNDDGSHEELDMGTIFDFFDPRSWPDSIEVSETAQQNRQLLRDIMVKHGFEPFETEWWHFTLKDEPYPDQYFDLIIE